MLTKRNLPAWFAAVNELKDRRAASLLQLMLLTGIEDRRLLQLQQLDLDPETRSVRLLLESERWCMECDREVSPDRFAIIPLSRDAWRIVTKDLPGTPLLFADRLPGDRSDYLEKAARKVAKNADIPFKLDDLGWFFSASALELGISWRVIEQLSDPEVSDSEQHSGRRRRPRKLRRVSQLISDAILAFTEPGTVASARDGN